MRNQTDGCLLGAQRSGVVVKSVPSSVDVPSDCQTLSAVRRLKQQTEDELSTSFCPGGRGVVVLGGHGDQAAGFRRWTSPRAASTLHQLVLL